MSDYFGALLRSAGALAATVPGAATGADLVEQEVEIEAAAPGERWVASAEPAREQAPEPTARGVDAPAAAMPAERAGTAQEPAPAPPVAAPDARSAAPRAPSESPALTHPMVRAALRWVGADPQAGWPPKDEATPARGDTLLPPTPRAATTVQPVAARVPPAAQPPVEDRVEPAGRPKPAPGIELTLPAAPRPHALPERVQSRPAAPPARPLDLHIGTIHVAVDAPAPRAASQPAAPAAAPPRLSSPPPERSAFARLRLPRL
ncbi:MAG TPA: hypothetical protein PKB14_15855 [Rubrivivax sp.]|nr:hypothetical protein [Rubrivivax sp.]